MNIEINSKGNIVKCVAFIEQSLIAGYSVNVDFVCEDGEQLADEYDYLIDLGDCMLGY